MTRRLPLLAALTVVLAAALVVVGSSGVFPGRGPGSLAVQRPTAAQPWVSDGLVMSSAGGAGQGPTLEELAGVSGHRVPEQGSGRLRVAPGEEPAPNPEAEQVMTVRVEVEPELDIRPGPFARFVLDTLNDPRSWGADGSVSFARTDGEADIRVLVASAGTVDDMCAPLATNGRWSCGRYGHAALNADRWVNGSEAFAGGGGSITAYRQYMVNHEVGHLLGNPHESCPEPGATAPVMVQQSISLQGCEPGPWPHP